MAAKKCSPDSVEFRMFQDYWKFFQDHLLIEDTDEYWETTIEAGRRLAKKYQNNKYVMDIIVAYLDMIERTAKARREKIESDS